MKLQQFYFMFKSNKQKVVISIILILLIFLSFDRLLSAIAKTIVLKSENRFSRLYSGRVNTDILILGNSRGVNTFYAPSIEKSTGLRTTNLSYNGMSMNLCLTILMDFLEHNPKPKSLILEITNLSSNDSLLLNLKQYCQFSNRLSSLFKEQYPDVFQYIRLSGLYAYNSEFFFRTIYYLFHSDRDWINTYTIDEKYIDKIIPTQNNQAQFYPDNIQSLEALIDIISISEKYRLDIKLVIGPYLPSYIRKISHFDQWKKTISKKIGNKHTIHDYSISIKNYIHFGDPIHLNKLGAVELNKLMMQDGVYNFTTR